jgi:O-antigen ligase
VTAEEPARQGLSGILFALLLLLTLFTPAIGVANSIFALTLIVWFTLLSREHGWRRAFSPPIVFWFGLLVAFLVLSAIFSLHPGTSLIALKGLFTFLFVPLFADSIQTERDAYRLVGALTFSSLVLCAAGLWQYLHGGNDLNHRIRASLSHYMTFSGILLVVVLALVGIAIEGPRRMKLPSAAAATVLGGTLLLTFTRNAYVGFLAAIILYLAIRKPMALFAVPVLALAAYGVSPADIRLRLLSTFDPADPTNRDRLAMAVAGLRMIRDFPVFGLGLTLVKPYYPLYRVADAPRWQVPHLHDNLLQIAAESGLFAAAMYVALLVCFFRATVRLLKRESEPSRRGLLAGAFLALSGVTVAGLFEYNFGDVEVLMTTLILLALPFSRIFPRPNAAG